MRALLLAWLCSRVAPEPAGACYETTARAEAAERRAEWAEWALAALAAERQAECAEAALAALAAERPGDNASRSLGEGWRKCGSRCDLEWRKFVIILSPGGRTGSTTVLGMVNRLPGVRLGGEHDGQLEMFRGLLDRVSVTERHKNGQAWSQSNSFYDKPREVYCLTQSWVFLHTGYNCAGNTVHGFKEIRYHSAPMLDFLRKAFPSAKYVISYRLNTAEQAKSGFHVGRDDQDELAAAEKNLLEFARQHAQSVFLLPVEHFGPAIFTKLFAFLGFPHCRAVEVLHANKDDSYSTVQEQEAGRFVSCG